MPKFVLVTNEAIAEEGGGRRYCYCGRRFKSFDEFYQGFIKKLKAAGKGDTTPEIPSDTQRALHILFGKLLRVLNARDCSEYETELQTLPESCRGSYHDLLQKAVMYIVVLFDCRVGTFSH